MSDDFIYAYQRELDALRSLGDAFAQAHPKIAGRLRLSRDLVDDPHVERLLEGVAFLTGRVQQRLDDDFPELTNALLDILYPHYLAPLPSGCIVQLHGMPDARTAVAVPTGAPLHTSAPDGSPCRFRTTAPLNIWPLRAHDARLQATPFDAPAHAATRRTQSVLSVKLSLADRDASFSDIAPDRLTFFIHGPSAQAIALYELLCAHTIGVSLAAGPNDDRPTPLPLDALQPRGFAPDEALYPWPRRSFSGLRLLTEYFALPEKFLFFDLAGIDARSLVDTRSEMTLFVYLDTVSPNLTRTLHPDALRLNCVPVVNLFDTACEPVRLTHWQTRYPVEPPAHASRTAAIWQIQSVREIQSDGASLPWQPLYRHLPTDDAQSAGEYVLSRQTTLATDATETWLTPIRFGTAADATPATEPHAAVDERLLSIDATMSDGDMPARLPFGGGAPVFVPEHGLGGVTRIHCLTPPTQSWRRRQRERSAWALITHLTLNHLSLTGGDEGAQALRDLLTLYDVRGSEQTRAAIAGLVSVESRPTVARLSDGLKIGLCRGIEVVLTFDATAWAEHGLFLLASVLDRFLALHVASNNFVRTTVRLVGHPDEVMRFPPRAGYRRVL
ncbi:type VI secretion system family protein [Ameyamaea chiangmaiensis NBRC 103196]|uniref:Type VI secretion system baseplate subunit TssF n=1 Tax=Ameyamaea chiangmaiensis TaxID=442969 RepID=A0A850PAK1_9PROT|nr:type VI secretion system baseplate subunit TssF [Ameyamaea chiangmaiensis]MBS4076089.1 type VI secretion system baseplate subunit TssF [Ameyamaea chiangmaiensis]NVN40978.1 type VI secretion system baseplate subunit TssF [Ameyamaea chiangmaiensis]GBQ66984.1 type VI secretion system family protein [Ameyamaea chiangmaiensis NBRC 103196]